MVNTQNHLVFSDQPGEGPVMKQEWQQHLTKMNQTIVPAIPKDHGIATMKSGVILVYSKSSYIGMKVRLTPQDLNTSGVIRLDPSTVVSGTCFGIKSTNNADKGQIFWEIM